MRLLLTAALLAATPVTARADIFAVPFMAMKFGGSTSIGADLEFAGGKRKFSMGAAVMSVDDRLIGYELAFGYIPGYLEADDAPLPLVKPGSFVVDLTGSVLLSMPPSVTGGGLRPYAALGAGLAHAQAAYEFDLFQTRRTVPVASIGGGATGLLTNSVGVRFDYRYLRSLTTDDGTLAHVGRRISYSRFTVGLLLRL